MNAHKPEEVFVDEAESVNAQSTQRLYEKLLRQHVDKDKIFVISDNASYYYNADLRAWLAEHPKIQQIFLPPYSPNLNLTERMWKFLRKQVINTRFYRDFQDFKRAILDFFNNLNNYKDELSP